ncbi:Fungal Zn(2)-Cys(6) binuclear cluster domain-containing protein [Penicillium ucsense]|uniref:Fungal Zn(2)-Cys(6) binuclear cluster domain-containing protein n=1 Tax=Penicillium ucsense TaxID=2839758 RepID=A0A8J8WM68_9EURO|nr:Fungal Zn(2)-Cys(6) binuclear cluster domain-containing protein [Penicillium ucsense]KAF7736498.1 Fungal Zn(2)-Cys(6) binuclear cluster domain-containing protein [Penicillium ucsense]
MTSSSRATGKRLPISCQACRNRKIRCSRDGRPCQTCTRRGLGAEDCIYLGQPRLSAEQSAPADATVQKELLARIRNLESLLQKQVHSQSATPTEGASPIGAPSATGSFTESELGISLETWGRSLSGNIGTLHTSQSGHVRYVPLASQWESVVARSPAADCLRGSDADFADEDDLQLPFAKDGSISRAEILALLPPGRHCDALKDVYFQVFSPVFHILHDLTFDAEYQQFCHDPSSVSTAWLALLFAILAIAISALNDDDPMLADLGRERTVSRNIKVISARYRSAALRCLAADGVMTRASISSLQALVLISYARLHRGLSFWTLLGFTQHVAMSMGCHIDPERFSLGLIEREERRRVWAGLKTLYTIQNTSFGSLDQTLLSHDVKMPADVDDVDLLTLPNMPATSDACSPRIARPTQMTFLLISSRLYKISNRVCEFIFTYPQSRFSISHLEAEVLAVRELCEARYSTDSSRDCLPIQHQANAKILDAHIHQLLLLLLRPTLCQFLQGEITPETCEAREKCMTSANAALSIFQSLLQDSKFAPYRWYTSGLGSFHAFHASVVLAVGLLNPVDQGEFDETKEILRKALEMFASLSVRSTFCSKAMPIVRQIIEVTSAQYQQTKRQETTLRARIQAQSHLASQTIGNQQQQSFESMSPSVTPMTLTDSFIVTHAHSRSHSQANSPVLTVASSCSEPTVSSSFGMHLHPQHWLAPTSVPWDTLGASMGQYKFEPDIL